MTTPIDHATLLTAIREHERHTRLMLPWMSLEVRGIVAQSLMGLAKVADEVEDGIPEKNEN